MVIDGNPFREANINELIYCISVCNYPLKHFSCNSSGLTDTSSSFICEFLLNNVNLEYIELNNNNFSDKGGEKILEGYLKSNTIKDI